ncbi:RHS repeat domain-containing protein [Paenibacillus taiwanensis]|uniref:RHS repeat domain-containing protein n=1 Tax=Paenibacillus taiwanensis TaxID=401638 RepID=UPI000410D892|nr:RHS repeat domain-containing protein [Paenibacillus taiwanensis]
MTLFFNLGRKNVLSICFLFFMMFIFQHTVEAKEEVEQPSKNVDIGLKSGQLKLNMMDPSIGHQIGRAVGDGWLANPDKDKQGYVSYGPYVSNLNLGEWVTSWSLKIDAKLLDSKEVARLEVYDPDTLEILAFQDIGTYQFRSSSIYQDFHLKFTKSKLDQRLEFRVYWYGDVPLQINSITTNQITKIHALKQWKMTDDGIGHNTGKMDGANWSANPQQDKAGYLSYGPYVRDLAVGNWETNWSLMIDNTSVDNAKVARLEVYDFDDKEIISSREITRQQFFQPNTTQIFALKFLNINPHHRLEFRVYWYGEVHLTEKSISTMKTKVIDYEKSWRMDDPSVGHRIGRIEGESWAANTEQDKEGYLSYGPYVKVLSAGTWKVSWPLMIDNNSADNAKVARLEVFDFETGEILSSREITRQQFERPMQYKNYNLNFLHTDPSHRLEFRVYWYGNAYIKMSDIQLKDIDPSLSGKVWNMFDPIISHQSGKINDEIWVVNPEQDKPGYMSYGPYEKKLDEGTWIATWSMRLVSSSMNHDNIVKIEVYDSTTGEILGFENISSQKFINKDNFHNFTLQFRNMKQGHALEFRAFWYGKGAVQLKNVKVNRARIVEMFIYDESGRLTQWSESKGKQKHFQYDTNGNLLRTMVIEE